jgi:ferredoxin
VYSQFSYSRIHLYKDPSSSQLVTYRIEFDRETCIGAGACVAATADFWSIDQDGKANLKSATYDTEKKVWVLELQENEHQKNLDAAQVCPVNAIHIYKDDEKII